jgi:hypothetical protein
MPDGMDNLSSETFRRLCRQGRLQEAARFAKDEISALVRENGFPDAFLSAFLPRLVEAAQQDLRPLAEAVSLAWQVAEAYRLYPEEPCLTGLRRLVLPAVDWAKGLEAAATLALRCPTLPFAAEYRSREATIRAARGRTNDAASGPLIRMERRVAVTEYRLGEWAASSASAGSARRTLLRSPQEREFLKAAKAFFVGREALPNVRLSNFIDIDSLAGRLPSEARRYALLAETDVLIATPVDFDPVGVVELDSGHHDTPVAQLRDAMKERILELAGVPLVRLRAEPAEAIHADAFYALLQQEWAKFEAFRPQGWREREGHTRLLPAA